MRRLITIVTDVADTAEFDDVYFALHAALEDRFQCSDERGELMARAVTGMRYKRGVTLGFNDRGDT